MCRLFHDLVLALIRRVTRGDTERLRRYLNCAKHNERETSRKVSNGHAKKRNRIKEFSPILTNLNFRFQLFALRIKARRKKSVLRGVLWLHYKRLIYYFIRSSFFSSRKKAQLRFKRASEDESAMQHCNIQFLV